MEVQPAQQRGVGAAAGSPGEGEQVEGERAQDAAERSGEAAAISGKPAGIGDAHRAKLSDRAQQPLSAGHRQLASTDGPASRGRAAA